MMIMRANVCVAIMRINTCGTFDWSSGLKRPFYGATGPLNDTHFTIIATYTLWCQRE